LIGKSSQKITYMLAWDSMAEREKRWSAFLADPEWVAVVAKTEKDGQLVENISSQLLAPAAFSAVKWDSGCAHDYVVAETRAGTPWRWPNRGPFWHRHAGTENESASTSAVHYRNGCGHWFRSCGNENWEFDENGLMRVQIASMNDLPIDESERKYHWAVGRRADDHPSLSELGL
jgi:hypothetical protein